MASGGYNSTFAKHWNKSKWKQNSSTVSPTSSMIWRSAPTSYGGIFDYDQKRERLTLLNQEMEDPKIWDDPKHAQELGREKKTLEDIVLVLEEVDGSIKDGRELFAMGKEEGDDDTLLSVEADNEGIEQKVAKLEFRRMFNNPSDPMPCFLEIQAGAGGTEAQDWAAMLLRMYLKFGEKRGFSVEVMEESEGDVAGIKSATVKFTGDHAYGTLRTETGIHRLVRNVP
jgi:peptide chain release factor 2